MSCKDTNLNYSVKKTIFQQLMLLEVNLLRTVLFKKVYTSA